jgi:hypothetical protein
MLQFSESVLHAVRILKKQTEEMVITGTVRDMEQYKFLMGRLEGYKFVEAAVLALLKENPDN